MSKFCVVFDGTSYLIMDSIESVQNVNAMLALKGLTGFSLIRSVLTESDADKFASAMNKADTPMKATV